MTHGKTEMRDEGRINKNKKERATILSKRERERYNVFLFCTYYCKYHIEYYISGIVFIFMAPLLTMFIMFAREKSFK